MNTPPTLAGWYIGICTNTTAGITANLLLQIHGVTTARLHGELGLSGGLAGGGPFHASFRQGRIGFTTCIPALQVIIEWSGERTRDGFAGSYQVTCDAAAPAHGVPAQQEGVWTCSLVRAGNLPGGDRQEAVFVYHEGAVEGPLGLEEFMHQMVANRWPIHALVARHAGTLWNTVGDCLAELQSQASGDN